MTQAKTTPEFGRWRSFFWPVHGYELKKLLPMFFMFFFISFVYSILRNTKDALLVTAPGSGAEAIPFLKVGGVVPAALIFMIIYAKLSNVLSKEKLFYATITPFIVFFLLFAFVLYPGKEYLHPTEFADKIQAYLPIGLSGLVATIRNWTYSLFYIFAELWGSFILSLLFWGFANDITKVTEAKRFYALFGLGANLALIAAGPALQLITKTESTNVVLGVDPWQTPLNYLTAVAVGASLMVMAIYRWINTNVLTDARFYDQTELARAKKEKPKMSMGESFKFLIKSKYILCIAIIVLSYNISINLIEVTWKNQVKELFPNKSEYLSFMGQYSTILGIVTIFMMLFVASNVMRRFGWKIAAYITPVVILITGIGFFSFVVFKEPLTPWLSQFGVTPLLIAVIFGTAQNIMSKSSKYSLFDPTKEMAYIPLDQESKVKGKAAIDTVGARLGKAGGSGIQLGLISVFGSLSVVTPQIGIILLLIVLAWMWAIRELGDKEFKKLEAKNAAEAQKSA
jgi:AAA family ATP:ADP antiporter